MSTALSNTDTYLFSCHEADDYIKVSIEQYSGPGAFFNDYSHILRGVLELMLNPEEDGEALVGSICQMICGYGVSSLEEANDIRAGIMGHFHRYTIPLVQRLEPGQYYEVDIDSSATVSIRKKTLPSPMALHKEMEAAVERGDWVSPKLLATYGL